MIYQSCNILSDWRFICCNRN